MEGVPGSPEAIYARGFDEGKPFVVFAWVDADVRCPVLVPFLLCPPKGSLWGAVKA